MLTYFYETMTRTQSKVNLIHVDAPIGQKNVVSKINNSKVLVALYR